MALTPAEKQKAYRDRERRKLKLLRKAANQPKGDLAAKLDPLFDTIFEMIISGQPPYSIIGRAALVKLERTLIAAGVMPGRWCSGRVGRVILTD